MPKAAVRLQRCFWTDGSELYDAYHDREWGRPVTDDIRLFEKISLEGFQVTHNVHIVGAEQICGLGDLLYVAVQGIDAAG